MRIIRLADQVRFQTMSTADLRSTFLVEDLFQPGEIRSVYVDLDRTVIGSAVPTRAPLTLEIDALLRSSYFLQRREMGVLNVGAKGTVEVDGHRYELDPLDALYIGRGSEQVMFGSIDPEHPAEFYLLSYPAHAAHPVRHIRWIEEPSTEIGSSATANSRKITRLIHIERTASCQLVMGHTQLAPGSVWNTMPPHTHMRRSEIYLYFDLPVGDKVVHLMGPASETRHLMVANKQVIISPGWSIHAGVGTSSYKFCWGMGGENQVYDDMDPVSISELR